LDNFQAERHPEALKYCTKILYYLFYFFSLSHFLIFSPSSILIFSKHYPFGWFLYLQANCPVCELFENYSLIIGKLFVDLSNAVE